MVKGRKGKRVIVFVMASALILLAVFGVVKLCVRVQKYSYNRTDSVLYNPFIGFAPNADYLEAVGDNRLIYVDVTWKELEPEEGKFDFESIYEENYLNKWRAEGKNVVFRFICDNPSDEEHMDIPSWLYDKTKDGTFYSTDYGKGYSPNYDNEVFIQYHKAAIEALGEEFGGDNFFFYIELGSVGHWGEWHVKYDEGIDRLPGWDVLSQYVMPYIEAFPNAKILMRRPFPAVREDGLGVYNDMTGEPDSTLEWLSWISDGDEYTETKKKVELPACPDVWETAPVGGEFTSSIPMEDMLTSDKERTLELLEESHMSFIGPKCPIACDEEEKFPDEVNAVRSKLGYCYGVSESSIAYSRLSGKLRLNLSISNYGAAPMYFDWPLCVYVLDDSGNVLERVETNIKLSEIAGGTVKPVEATLALDKDKFEDIPILAIGIENPETGEAEIQLDMDVENYGYKYLLN